MPRLHVVTDDRIVERGDLIRTARAVLEAGGPDLVLHLRGPGATGARLYEIACALVPVAAAAAGALLLVNDRVDVALVAGAHGAHLGRRSLGVAPARRILGEGARVGVSTHGPDEAARAAREGADFAFVGTVYPTPTHPGRPGGGAEVVRAAAGAAPGLPLLAIGGVGPERVGEMLEAGAHGVAVIRGVWEAGDPVDRVKGYLEALDGLAGRTTAGARAQDAETKDR